MTLPKRFVATPWIEILIATTRRGIKSGHCGLDDSRTRMEKDWEAQQNEFDDKAFWSPPPAARRLSGADEGAVNAARRWATPPDASARTEDGRALASADEGEGHSGARQPLPKVRARKRYARRYKELRTPFRDLRQPGGGRPTP